jgi:hypothetical protein
MPNIYQIRYLSGAQQAGLAVPWQGTGAGDDFEGYPPTANVYGTFPKVYGFGFDGVWAAEAQKSFAIETWESQSFGGGSGWGGTMWDKPVLQLIYALDTFESQGLSGGTGWAGAWDSN